MIKNHNQKICNLNITTFQGPLDLFYQIIKEKKVDIITINLNEVISQYVSFVNAYFKQMHMDELMDYLLMCTYLLEQKSKKIIPHFDNDKQSEEDIARDKFIQNLLLYKQYQNLIPQWQKNIKQNLTMYPRIIESEDKSVYLNETDCVYDLAKLDLNNILAILQRIYQKLKKKQKQNILKTAKIQANHFSIENVQDEIVTFLQQNRHISKITLTDYVLSLNQTKWTKKYLIMVFVALLVLVKKHLIRLEQNDYNVELFLVLNDGV